MKWSKRKGSAAQLVFWRWPSVVALVSLTLLSLLNLHEVAVAQTFTVLYTFNGLVDGSLASSLIKDANGNLYAPAGGGSFRYGRIIEVGPSGEEIILHNFDGADGIAPDSRLIRDQAGNFYGTTADGGSPKGGSCFHGCGEVFKMDRAGAVTILHAFNGGSDGATPGSTLKRDRAGNLFGTTEYGGLHNWGTVYEVDVTGHELVLHEFTAQKDGGGPEAIVLDAAGNLYGSAEVGGGDCFCGTIFKLGANRKLRVLYTFKGAPDGAVVQDRLIRDDHGVLYGTTYAGGTGTACRSQFTGCGTIFSVDRFGNQRVLYSFSGDADGSRPYSLIRDPDGNLYGITTEGGDTTCSANASRGCGTVFRLDVTGKLTTLYTFHHDANGDLPWGLMRDAQGNLYGSTSYGGDPVCDCGTVYKITP